MVNDAMTRTASRAPSTLNDGYFDLMHTPFSVLLLEIRKGRKKPTTPVFRNLPAATTRYMYPGSPFDFGHRLISLDRIGQVIQFTEHMRKTGTRATIGHQLLQQGAVLPKLHVTYIGRRANGDLFHRRSLITLRNMGTRGDGKVSILTNMESRLESYHGLFPNYMQTNGKLHENAHGRDLCAWAVPSHAHRTIYMISHDVLFTGSCTKEGAEATMRMKPEGLVLLGALNLETHEGHRGKEVHLVRFILKAAADARGILRTKMFMPEEKLQKLAGRTNTHCVQRLYAINRDWAAAKRRRNRQRDRASPERQNLPNVQRQRRA
jgi:hypothetical protein